MKVAQPSRRNPAQRRVAYLDALRNLAVALRLTPEELDALKVVCEWEGFSPLEYCRRAVLSIVNASREDMATAAKSRRRGEANHARRFLAQLRQAKGSR